MAKKNGLEVKTDLQTILIVRILHFPTLLPILLRSSCNESPVVGKLILSSSIEKNPPIMISIGGFSHGGTRLTICFSFGTYVSTTLI
jgi:hypothetical protein